MIGRMTGRGGFTMIELVMIIVIIGILTGIAAMQFSETVETSKHEATRAELEALAFAIAGNPAIYTDGRRSDFGYVGDVGALPPDLDALFFNPGYSTWDGPYIKGNISWDDFKRDAWNTEYVYVDTLLRSVGSGSDIDKIYTPSSASLLSNTVSGYILDAGSRVPGAKYCDSILVNMTCPDGSGGLANLIVNPDAGGNFSFFGIPIGDHTVSVIYTPDGDTVEYKINVSPGSDVKVEVLFPANLW